MITFSVLVSLKVNYFELHDDLPMPRNACTVLIYLVFQSEMIASYVYGSLDELKSLTVKEVTSLLWKRPPDVPDHLVGIKGPMDDIIKKLDVGTSDVRYIVIYGMGGIGKTTLADVVFRQSSPQFQGHCCFLKDVRRQDILSLQKKLLSDILNLRCMDLSDIEVADMIKMRFQ